jgi:hypothetical protein
MLSLDHEETNGIEIGGESGDVLIRLRVGTENIGLPIANGVLDKCMNVGNIHTYDTQACYRIFAYPVDVSVFTAIIAVHLRIG